MRNNGWRKGWRRISDPRAISWPTLLISFVIFLLDTAFQFQSTLPGPGSPGGPIVAIAALVSAQCVLFGFLFAMRFTILRIPFSRRHPIITVVTFAIGSGLALTTGTAVGDALSETPTYTVVVVDTVMFQTVVLSLTASFVVALNDYRRSVAALRQVQEQLLMTRQAGEQQLVQERAQVLREVDDAIDATLSTLAETQQAPAVDDLRRVARDVVRPLSHELASTPATFSPPVTGTSTPRWQQVANRIVATPVVSPLLMALAVTVLATRLTTSEPPEDLSDRAVGVQAGEIGVSIDATSALLAIAFLAAMFVSVWVSAWFVRRFTAPRLPNMSSGQRWITAVASFALIAVVSQSLIQIAFLIPGFEPSVELTLLERILYLLPLLIVAVIIVVIRSVSAQWSVTQSELEAANDDLSWEIAKTRDILRRQRRSLSQSLHGPLQSALTAGAMALESSPATNDADVQTIENVKGNITAALAGLHAGAPTEHWRSNLDSVRRTWAGVCHVVVDVDDVTASRLDADARCAATAVDVIGEAIANAALHGQASRADVRITLSGNRLLELTIEDDGRFDTEKHSSPGLGSQILDEVSTSWSLDPAESGSRLRVLLPLEAGNLLTGTKQSGH